MPIRTHEILQTVSFLFLQSYFNNFMKNTTLTKIPQGLVPCLLDGKIYKVTLSLPAANLESDDVPLLNFTLMDEILT